MPAVRINVVSDTHLSGRTPEASENWESVAAWLGRDRADLIVHTGDISADGQHHPEDLTYAQELLAPLEHRMVLIPGNHDTGDAPSATGDGGATIDPSRLERYRSVFGPDRWCLTVGRWHLIGINSQLLGSGLDAERDQDQWLTATVARLPIGAPVALFLHKPIDARGRRDDDARQPGRYVPIESRTKILDLVARRSFRVVVSGHVHQWGPRPDPDLTTVWAPSTWAVFADRDQPTIEHKRAGFATLTLHDDGSVDAQLVEPPGLRQLVYGSDVLLSR